MMNQLTNCLLCWPPKYPQPLLNRKNKTPIYTNESVPFFTFYISSNHSCPDGSMLASSSAFNVNEMAASKFTLESLKNNLRGMENYIFHNLFNHILIDVVAPHNLCFQDWLKGFFRSYFGKFILSQTKIPFRLDG